MGYRVIYDKIARYVIKPKREKPTFEVLEKKIYKKKW
jgi:hypothetical protein